MMMQFRKIELMEVISNVLSKLPKLWSKVGCICFAVHTINLSKIFVPKISGPLYFIQMNILNVHLW